MADGGDQGGGAAGKPSRRGFVTSLPIVAGGLVMGMGAGRILTSRSGDPAVTRPRTEKEIAEVLRAGNERFAAGGSQHPNLGAEVRRAQAEKQTPFAAVLACADSRVSPELVYDQGIGDLFVVRVAGNTASAEAVASLAYAVEHLGVTYVVVMGHESCGAVKATLEGARGKEVPAELRSLTEPLLPAVRSALAAESEDAKVLSRAVAENARSVARSLTGRSRILDEAYGKDELTVHPAVYDVLSGVVVDLA